MKRYAEMCDCPEIQGLLEAQTGLAVWLPRQEDIQEMLQKYYAPENPPWCIDDIEDQFHRFFIAECNCPPFSHTITEHLQQWDEIWLAFYMHEVHNKHWSAENWT